MYFWVPYSTAVTDLIDHSTSLTAKALFYRTSWLSWTCGLQVRLYKNTIFDLQGHYGTIQGHWFDVKRAYHYSIVWQSSLPKGTVITSLSAFQLTPSKGIIGNHPCNVVPLSFWQLNETTALWFCPLDVKSELKTPSVPQAWDAISYICSHNNIYGWQNVLILHSTWDILPKI